MKKSIFDLNNQEPIILQFLDDNYVEDFEEVIISETKLSRSENTNLYDLIIAYFKEYGVYTNYFRNRAVAGYIDDTAYFECNIYTPSEDMYHRLLGIFILNFGSELFIRNIRDLKNGVSEPVLRLYIPYNEKDLENE